MKTITLLVVVLLMALGCQSPVSADPTISMYAQSPDHPSTWVVGADNIHQALRWDASRNMLFADVKYSTVLYADSVHPTKVDDLTLSFPSVKLDSASNQLIAHGVAIGSVQQGLFGSHVVLTKGVDLSIHRHEGQVYGKIVPTDRN